MKKIILLFSVLLCLSAAAQKNKNTAGKLFVMVKDTAGKTMARKTVKLTVEYEPSNMHRTVHGETFRVTTDANGMATLVRGKGIERTGSYAAVTKSLKLKDDVWIYIFRNTGDMTDDYLLQTYLQRSGSGGKVSIFAPPRIVSDEEVNKE